MVFFRNEKKISKNIIKKINSNPSFLNTLQDHYNDSSMLLCDILIQSIIHFKRKKKEINKRRILNNGTKNKIKGHRHGFNGNSIL